MLFFSNKVDLSQRRSLVIPRNSLARKMKRKYDFRIESGSKEVLETTGSTMSADVGEIDTCK